MDCSTIICIVMLILLAAAVLIFINLPTIHTAIKQGGGAITWHERVLTAEPVNGTGMDKHLKYIAYNAIPVSRERRRILDPTHDYSRDISVLNRVLDSRLSYKQQLSKSMKQPSEFEPDMVIEMEANRRLLIEFDEGDDFHNPSTDLRYAAKQQEYYSHILSNRNDMILLRITYKNGLHASNNGGVFKLDGTGVGDNAIRAIVEYVASNFSTLLRAHRMLILARLNIMRNRLISVDIRSFTKNELSTLIRTEYRRNRIIISMKGLFDNRLEERDGSDFYITVNGSSVTVGMNMSDRAHGGANQPIMDLNEFIKTNISPYIHATMFYGRDLDAAIMNKVLTEKDAKDIGGVTASIIFKHISLYDLFMLYDPRTSRYESYWSISNYKEKIAKDEYINKYKQLKESVANSSSYSDKAKSYILSVLLIREYAAYTDDWWYGPKHPDDDLRDWFTYDSPEKILCDLPWILDVKGNLERYKQYLVPYVYELWGPLSEDISGEEWFSCRTTGAKA